MANAEARLAALEQALTAVAGRRRIIREVPKPSKFRNYYDFFRAFKRYAQGQTDIVSDQKESLYLILQTDQDKIRINSAEGMLDNPGIGYDAFSDHLLTMFCPQVNPIWLNPSIWTNARVPPRASRGIWQTNGVCLTEPMPLGHQAVMSSNS